MQALRRLALATVFLPAWSGLASAAPAEQAPLRFLDGAREVIATRLPGAPTAADGRITATVALRYVDGRTIFAGIDKTAIVRLAPGGEDAIVAHRGRLVRPLSRRLGLWLVEDTSDGDGLDLAARFAAPDVRQKGVLYATPNLHLRRRPSADYTPTDPRYGGQWYFQNLDMPSAWGLSRGAASSTIVIVDTGCDVGHPDLASKMEPGRDVVDGDDDPSPILSEPGSAHGTACAGLAAAATDNDEGIAGGCPECRLSCVRLLSDAPVPIAADVEAFQFALDIDAAVVSNSWGFVDPIPVPQAFADIIREVATTGRGGKGALVLFAAGNDDRDLQEDEVENAEGVFCVGAINNFDEATPFTNRGPALDIVAPTGTITTDIRGADGNDPTDYMTNFGGTSSACPVAAGVAGLLASAAPDKTSRELYEIMTRTAKTAPFAMPDGKGHDVTYGYGILDPTAALREALDLPPEGTGGNGGAGGSPEGGAGGETGGGDGCGCRTAATEDEAPLLLLVAGIGLVAQRRRKSRRHASANTNR